MSLLAVTFNAHGWLAVCSWLVGVNIQIWSSEGHTLVRFYLAKITASRFILLIRTMGTNANLFSRAKVLSNFQWCLYVQTRADLALGVDSGVDSRVDLWGEGGQDPGDQVALAGAGAGAEAGA